MLAALGAPVDAVDERTVRVTAGAPAPLELAVPGDPSSAAFWVVARHDHARLRARGRRRARCNPTRIAFVDVLRRMGATDRHRPHRRARWANRWATCTSPRRRCTARPSSGAEIPLVHDEMPVLAVAAAFADGVTEIRDAGELRVKESDRIATVESTARAASASGWRPPTDAPRRPGRAPAGVAGSTSHGDHRIAMAGGDRGERHRRRVGGRRLAGDRGRRIPSSPTTSLTVTGRV